VSSEKQAWGSLSKRSLSSKAKMELANGFEIDASIAEKSANE
jgi:hypothetical protein